jgi:hypothetical protein
MRSRWVAVVVLAGVLAAGCTDDKIGTAGSEDGDPAAVSTSTTVVAQNPCSLTQPNQVQLAYGAIVSTGRGSSAASCRFVIQGMGQVRFTIIAAKGRSLTDVAPDATFVDAVGDEARWSPYTPDVGGVLFVRRGDRILQFDARLAGEPDVIKARTVGWARLVLERYDADRKAKKGGKGGTGDKGDKGTTTTSTTNPLTQDTPPCKLLTKKDLEVLFDRVIVPDITGESCTYTLTDGTSVMVGPITRPASPATIDRIDQTVTIDGKTTSWTREKVKMGMAAVLLSNPQADGDVSFYVVQGPELLRVAVLGRSTEEAGEIAKKVAQQVIARR